MPAAINQLLAGFRQNDAISDEALCLQRIFRSWGHASEIFCETRCIDPLERANVRDLDDYEPVARAEDIVLLHLSIGSKINERFQYLPSRKALLYHNITPAEGFRMINPSIAADLEAGRAQIASLAGVAEINLADSAFNAAELESMGFGDVRVLPLVLDLERFNGPFDVFLRRRLDDGALNVLFVGRCAPNKRIEDLIRVVHVLEKIMPERICRLIHVGSYVGTEAYYTLMLSQARELGLRDVIFLGAASQAELIACYRTAKVFLCLSEHEGFCVPLIEAMIHNIPIVALARAAVPETLDGAGILIRDRDIALIAETVARVAGDARLREALLARQSLRVKAYCARDTEKELREHLAPMLRSPRY